MIIIDDFVEDEKLIADILADEDFWRKGFRWWDGKEVKDNRHRLIEYIWKHNLSKVGDFNRYRNLEYEGFEHWTGVYKAGAEEGKDWGVKEILGERYSLHPHVDKDEDLWYATDKKVNSCPLVGTVYYMSDTEEGGYLKVWDTESGEIDFDRPYELIKPKFNRLVIFDAGKLHAVTEVTKGERRAVAINIWDRRPTTELEE